MVVVAIDGSGPNSIRANFNVQHCHVRKFAHVQTKSRGAGEVIQCGQDPIQCLASTGTG